MILTYILFAIGFELLIKGADYLVDGSSSIAKRLGMPSLFIGLTIVAFGTSLPELLVSVFASFSGNNEIAIANVLGSNLSNILLITGIAAIICPIVVQKGTAWKGIPLALLGVLAVGFMLND